MARAARNAWTTVALNLNGAWNLPLLDNAARCFGAQLRFVADGQQPCDTEAIGAAGWTPESSLEVLASEFDRVLACETSRQAHDLFEFPAPRGRVAIVFGNEEHGLTREALRSCDGIVTIPMRGRGMSSINVAVSAAICLHAFHTDFARKHRRRRPRRTGSLELVIAGLREPAEIGSLLRSAWAFGWRRAFLADPHGAWFTRDTSTIRIGRAAARREINPIVVRPATELTQPVRVLQLDGRRDGTPLGRVDLDSRPTALHIGPLQPAAVYDGPTELERVSVEQASNAQPLDPRHAGSTAMAHLGRLARRR